MARGEPTAGSVVRWEVQSGNHGRNSVLVWPKEQMAEAKKLKVTPREGSRTRAAGRPDGREGRGEGRPGCLGAEGEGNVSWRTLTEFPRGR